MTGGYFMKWFFDLGNRYAKTSNWVDFAFVKFCLFAMGVLVGIHIDSKYKKQTELGAGMVFIATYIPLMAKVFRVAKEK